jgi:hypothetical protein
VADLPFVSPEKSAFAIWQKNGLDITSVNGRAVVTPPQVPVSALSRDEPTVNATTRRGHQGYTIHESLIGSHSGVSFIRCVHVP